MNKTKRIVPSKRGDDFFDFLVTASGILVLIVLGGIILSLIYASWPSISRFGFSFLWNKEWDTNADLYGALVPIYGTLVTSAVALIIAVPVSFGIAIFLTELSPNWLKKPMGIAIELLAAIPSIVYGMWGLFIFSPLFAMYFQIPLDDILSNVPILNIFFTGPAFGLGLLAAGIILAIMIIPYISSVMRDVFEQTPVLMKEAAYGVGCTTWECMRHIVLPYTKNGVIGGIMLGLGRALGETMAVTFVIGNTFQLDSFSLFETGNTITSVLANEFAEAGKELHVSSLMELGLILFGITFIVLAYSKYLVSKLNKIEEPKDKSAFKTWLPRFVWLVIFGLFLYFSFTQFDEESQTTVFKWLDAFYACLIIVLAVVVCWALKTLFRLIDLEFRRKLLNKIALFVAFSAMVFGCIWLVWILFSTVEQGIAGLSLSVFTEMTPPPMEAGGLANAIVGSLILIFFATLLGTPLGILAGIYLAEYGKNNALASVIRFINDVLLSAPSIIIGLFVYMIFVVNMGHYSGVAGFVALAIIQIPIVVRTTENMLNLVPNTLREAAYALGSPRWKVISSITLKASYSGIMTGILLAIARISGETAPLLFTSLSNQFWSTDITQPIASLPVTIFKFAMSPYQNWQSLAWVSVLLITGFVLVLNILARFLFNQKS